MIKLAIAAVIARGYDLRPDRHPTLIVAGPTLTWKTSTGLFLYHMLGLDPSKRTVNLAAESGRSLWLRKTSTGRIACKRELLDTPLVVFDEYQVADPECRRLLSVWMDGRKKVALEDLDERVAEWKEATLRLKAEAFTEEVAESWKWMSREYARSKLGL